MVSSPIKNMHMKLTRKLSNKDNLDKLGILTAENSQENHIYLDLDISVVKIQDSFCGIVIIK